MSMRKDAFAGPDVTSAMINIETVRQDVDALALAKALEPTSQDDYESYLRAYLETAHPATLLDIKDMTRLLRKSKSWIYSKCSRTSKQYDPEFPVQTKLSDKGSSALWIEREVISYLLGRIVARRESGGVRSKKSGGTRMKMKNEKRPH